MPLRVVHLHADGAAVATPADRGGVAASDPRGYARDRTCGLKPEEVFIFFLSLSLPLFLSAIVPSKMQANSPISLVHPEEKRTQRRV